MPKHSQKIINFALNSHLKKKNHEKKWLWGNFEENTKQKINDIIMKFYKQKI